MPSLPSNPRRSERSADRAVAGALLDARRAVGAEWSLAAMIGADAGGTVVLLARHERSGELAIVSARPDAGSPNGVAVAVTSEIHTGVPAPRSLCPACGAVQDGWPARCVCGTDLAECGRDGSEGTDAETLEGWLRVESGDRYDVLGGVPHAERCGTTFFARRREDGAIVALHVYEGERKGGDRLRVAESEPMVPLDPVERRSPLSGPVHFTPAEAIPVVSDADEQRDNERRARLEASGLGSGLLAKLPTPRTDEQVAVPRVCPQCGAEYETGSRFCPNDGSPLRPKVSADPLIGAVIADRYQVLRRLGEGGMGRVYLAEHVKMTRQCALKVMNAQIVNDEDSAQRFAREASNAARIIHPNVAAVFDYGESDGVVYLVMEYVDGEPLSRLLERDGVVPPHRALDIARQVAEGLIAAHELGIVHRDLKPDNILLTRARSGREVAKVVDFGIAKAMSESREDRLTQTGLVIGTPEYMSPEQLVGDPVDARSDIYSLGCILFQMLTGQLPFDAPTREQIIKKRLAEAPPHARDLLPGLPDPLDRVVRTMLARSPMDRYPSALELRQALDPVTALGRNWDPSVHLTPRSQPTLLMAAVRTTEKLESEETLRRRRMRRFAGGALAVLALGGTTFGYVVSRARARLADPSAQSFRDSLLKRTPGPVMIPSSPQVVVAATPMKGATSKPGASAPAPTATAPAATETAASRKTESTSVVPAAMKAMRAPIEAYARAWETRDVARVKAAYPALPDSAANILQSTFFRPTQEVRARVSDWGDPTVSGDSGAYPFTLHLRNTYSSGAQADADLKKVAELRRGARGWIITRIIDR